MKVASVPEKPPAIEVHGKASGLSYEESEVH